MRMLTTACLIIPCFGKLAVAAESAKTGAEKLHDFGLAGSNVNTPGYGRVLLVFALIVALAWGATWILRRYGARFRTAAAGATASIRAIGRHTLPGGIACHVVEIQGRQVLITVTRHGVTSLVLGDIPPAASAPGQGS
jgi:hypothetical protein